MNSILQSLLTLTRFVQEVHNHEKVWDSQPKGELFRGFVEVGVCHFSTNTEEKTIVPTVFEEKVSYCDPKFEDDGQKDAHEFLCVLNNTAIKYICPVPAHIAVQMLSIRTCKRCGQAERLPVSLCSKWRFSERFPAAPQHTSWIISANVVGRTHCSSTHS